MSTCFDKTGLTPDQLVVAYLKLQNEYRVILSGMAVQGLLAAEQPGNEFAHLSDLAERAVTIADYTLEALSKP